jgi:hypothetical protein
MPTRPSPRTSRGSTPSPGRFGRSGALVRRTSSRKQQSGLRGLASRLPSAIGGSKGRGRSRKAPAVAALAGLGGLAAAFAKRRRGGEQEPPPPEAGAPADAPQPPVGAGVAGNGSAG